METLSADDFVLYGDGEGYVLKFRGQDFNLTVEALARIARIGSTYAHDIPPDTDTGEPYVVSVDIPYDDVSADQTTTEYSWGAAFADRKTAVECLITMTEELDAMGRGFGSVKIPPVPELKYDMADVKVFESASEALSDFRYAIAVESSHYPRAAWWHQFGLDSDDKYADDLDAVRERLKCKKGELTREIRDKRMAIARDVIARIDDDKLEFTALDYIKLNYISEDAKRKWEDILSRRDDDLQNYVDRLEPVCLCCATGAMLLSYARLFGRVPISAISDDVADYMEDVFDDKTLTVIESMFTREPIPPPGTPGPYLDLFDAAEYGKQFICHDTRCRTAMQNILDNDGEFKLPRRDAITA